MSLTDAAMMTIKEKLLWSVSSKEFSVMLKPAECAILLKEVWELEEPTGTVDIKQWESERPRSTGVPGMRDEQTCKHEWGAEAPDFDGRECTLCGFVQTNAERARMAYQGDPGDEAD